MDGEAGWWTTSGNIGLPPLARAMGVGRQHNCDACAVVSVCCEYTKRVRECEGYGNASVGNVGGVVSVSAGIEYMGGTRGSGIVSSVDDVLEMSVVRGMRGVGHHHHIVSSNYLLPSLCACLNCIVEL